MSTLIFIYKGFSIAWFHYFAKYLIMFQPFFLNNALSLFSPIDPQIIFVLVNPFGTLCTFCANSYCHFQCSL